MLRCAKGDILLKSERHFSLGENSSFNKGVLGENTLNHNLQETSLREKET